MTSHVQMIVPQALTPEQVKQWFSCVESHTPSGLITGTTLPGVDKNKQSTYFTKKTSNGKHAYVIPLVRDLDASEVHEILKAWCALYPQGDFTFDYSQSVTHKPKGDTLTQHKWDQILDAWGKCQHAKWLQRHAEDGWRYGVILSTKEKTHPWMQPWESLPHKARELNLQGVRDLMSILDDFGYVIIQTPKS